MRFNDRQIDYMVNRFLTWRLPEDFNPDAGISFYPLYNLGTPYEGMHRPTGTNLFDYNHSYEMVKHMIEDLPAE